MKKIITILSAFALSFTLAAQSDITSAFIAMPDSLLVTLNAELRASLMELPDSSTLTVQNIAGDPVERLSLSDDYLSIRTSEAGTLEIKLLPLVNNTNIIGVITTVCGRACDSSIDFYTTTWQPLSKESLFPQKEKEWFLSKSADPNLQEVKNAFAPLDMTPIKLSFSPNNTDIKAKYEIKKYLSKDDYKKLEPYLAKDSHILYWDKQSYK